MVMEVEDEKYISSPPPSVYGVCSESESAVEVHSASDAGGASQHAPLYYGGGGAAAFGENQEVEEMENKGQNLVGFYYLKGIFHFGFLSLRLSRSQNAKGQKLWNSINNA
ncbi:hypothetical protein PIB30_009718 [Stylosanthes scabra]|uniref:Uncharacterized protein n=1 Tax=Stylosanthes scabra TaxID=79078 RepID=A0ABU6W3K6_9FABA|nr:hypothetical protein [Stylosanthes scabra]